MPRESHRSSTKSVRAKDEPRHRSRSKERRRHEWPKKHEDEDTRREQQKGHRKRDPSSSSSSSNYNEKKFDKLLDKKRLEKLREEKERKRRLKELETPDEKRARRLAKKLRKEERRRTEALNALPEGIPYTDLNNPFNDTNLTETFIWKKKWEGEGKGNVSRKKVEKVNRETIAKNYAEMEQLKRNREARDAAKEDMEMITRDQERRLCDWNRTEDSFHLKQAKLRSGIRIKEGRAKAIDLLGRYILYAAEDNTGEGDEAEEQREEFELDNPLTYLPKDSINDLEDLLADIKVYRVIDGQRNKRYWDDIETVAKNTLKNLLDSRRRSSESGTVHSSVQQEVLNVFKAKTYEELGQLEAQITSKIKNASKGTDISYWESLLDSLRPYMAKQRLKELHTKILQIRLKRIREEQMKNEAEGDPSLFSPSKHEEAQKEEEEGPSEAEEPTITSAIAAQKDEEEELIEMEMDIEEMKTIAALRAVEPAQQQYSIQELLKMEDEQRDQAYQQMEAQSLLEQFTLSCYTEGGYSPSYGNETQTMPGIEILDEQEDKKKMVEIRKEKSQRVTGEKLTARDQRMMEIAKQGMSQDEAEFAVEESLEKQNFLWSDKYRPRKPRYFNRVHTGFDWNKYNQTHYDIDNPPPKIVQGYRFNIFYPDLLDPSNTPGFTLTRCEDPDFAIVRFRAGPPYEDIAFKIVNREWEVSHRHGYKVQFQNGIFQLWFFFKRYRYRR